ncbi:MAG: nicotinate-nucleotide adenylyltransferase [Cyanobium sp. NAT70]|nr:nicotinate-nucleotide adenylyltransferase [Cyanobium sp. NAT70]|tara:strand:- start:633 stop:1211 length:579 start_codon:yes stop_codon:yes gene_type:complete
MADAIALLGTSADPPTHGHQTLLNRLLTRYAHVATWASDNPIKQHGAPLALRSKLLEAVVVEIDNPNLQLVQELSSPFTRVTLERAAARWPHRDLIFVVGSDLAHQIPNWKQADQWLMHLRLAIVHRQGWPLRAEVLTRLQNRGATVDVLDLSIPASASSELRQSPQQSQVPATVWPLLLQHNLYGLTPSRC